MITEAQAKKMQIAITSLIQSQSFIPESRLKGLFNYTYKSRGGDEVRLFIGNVKDSDLPMNMKQLMKTANINKVIKLIEDCDASNEGQVYLTLLLASFYPALFHTVGYNFLVNGDEFNTDGIGSFSILGFNKQTDARLESLVKLLSLSDLNLNFNNNQIAYLKTAILKIVLMFY